jgi:gentisate 1,2-dioxygenase
MAEQTSNPARNSFYEEISRSHLAPLWEVMAKLVPPEPRSACVPVHWSYPLVREWLSRSGDLISAEEAERRVLVLENPALRGQSRITNSLYAGLQLILPGEVAHSHRHTATAIRLILEGEGAYTSVDGERTPMHPGDFIITPSWTFHDHSNPGDVPVVWLDGLDVPIVQFFEAGFSERLLASSQPLARADDESLALFGQGLAPADHIGGGRNPLFRYPYERTRASLEYLARVGRIDAHQGVRQQFVDPATGGAATRTMGAFMQWLPAGFKGRASRETASVVYCAVEGGGESTIGSTTVHWRPRDVFVAPAWMPVTHRCDGNSVLFSFSDRPVQRALGFWRQETVE